MKKIFKKLTAIIMACCCLLLVYGCDCEHIYTSEITKEATCGEVGVKTYTCTECGEAYTEEIAKLTAHAYTDEVTKEATCTATGIRTYTCSVCGDTYSEGIARLEHKYTDEVTKEATCAETGVRTYTCSVCGDTYSEGIAKLEHKYTDEVTKEATCAETGVRTYTCSVCGDTYTKAIVKSSVHEYTDEVTKEATCIETGIRTYTCNVCGDTYTEDIAKSATHEYMDEVTKEATCAETGVRTYTCSDCGDFYTETISEKDHSYAIIVTKEPTCTTEGEKTHVCSDCGKAFNVELFSKPEYSANEVFEKSKNSVGEIITYDKNGNEFALGTGFVYSTDGKILTNYHVIEEAYSAKITINGTSYTIESVLAYDKTIDLAVLKISATNLTVVDICTKEHAVGKTVYAFGSSKGLTATFSQGIITCADREMDGVHYVQHDAAISSGNSGGPLINGYGEIIGINTMTVRDAQNLNFAISTSELSNLEYGTSMTLAELYEKEFGSNDSGNSGSSGSGNGGYEQNAFTKVKNYVKQKGSYSSGVYTYTLGYSYPSDYSSTYKRQIQYDVAEEQLCLMLWIDSTNLVGVYIDAMDGVYTWAYTDQYGYGMAGALYATSFTSSTLLGYSVTDNIPYNGITTVRKLASAMVALLVSYIDTDFSSIGVDASDFGFYYF